MTAVVEFHAFTDNKNQFIIKELAIVGDSFQTQIVFRSPYCKCVLNQKQQRTARWLSRHFHGIKWEEGSIDYNEDIIRTLCKPFNKIYSKGLEKVRFLNEFHDNVFELPEEGTSSTVVVHIAYYLNIRVISSSVLYEAHKKNIQVYCTSSFEFMSKTPSTSL